MIIKKKDRSYTTHKKYIQGKGFLDSISSTLRNVGAYISQNKDLIAKPMLGAVGNLAAFGLTELGKQQLSRLINKNNKAKTTELSPKDLEIIQNILPNSLSDKVALTKSVPTTNIIGSGIKKF